MYTDTTYLSAIIDPECQTIIANFPDIRIVIKRLCVFRHEVEVRRVIHDIMFAEVHNVLGAGFQCCQDLFEHCEVPTFQRQTRILPEGHRL